MERVKGDNCDGHDLVLRSHARLTGERDRKGEGKKKFGFFTAKGDDGYRSSDCY